MFFEPSKARLVIALMWQSNLDEKKATQVVSENFGQVVSQTNIFDFSHTSYYEKEMGRNLKKIFLEVDGLYPRDSLKDHKLKSVALEKKHLDASGFRLFNIDPMLLSLDNIVVATTKGYAHRIYLGEGIYGDVCFIRREGRYQFMPWTYADYKEHVDYFEKVRGKLRTF